MEHLKHHKTGEPVSAEWLEESFYQGETQDYEDAQDTLFKHYILTEMKQHIERQDYGEEHQGKHVADAIPDVFCDDYPAPQIPGRNNTPSISRSLWVYGQKFFPNHEGRIWAMYDQDVISRTAQAIEVYPACESTRFDGRRVRISFDTWEEGGVTQFEVVAVAKTATPYDGQMTDRSISRQLPAGFDAHATLSQLVEQVMRQAYTAERHLLAGN